MKPAAFDYKRARTLPEAAEFLAAGNGDAKILAGGQSLAPMLNLRLARPHILIDIKRAEGLRELAGDDKVMSIGAGWTHAEIEDGAFEDPTRGLLPYVARGIAYRAVRNRGTIGGSLSHADPAADWISTMAALGATLVAQGADGRSAVCAADTLSGRRLPNQARRQRCADCHRGRRVSRIRPDGAITRSVARAASSPMRSASPFSIPKAD